MTTLTFNTPRMYTAGDQGWGVDEVGLQRTCQLVEEWSDKFGAKVEVKNDFDGIERRYRVVTSRTGLKLSEIPSSEVHQQLIDAAKAKLKQAIQEAETIARFARNGHPNGLQSLLDFGYSQTAIDEVIAGRAALNAK